MRYDPSSYLARLETNGTKRANYDFCLQSHNQSMNQSDVKAYCHESEKYLPTVCPVAKEVLQQRRSHDKALHRRTARRLQDLQVDRAH